jgi:hypothetical protein
MAFADDEFIEVCYHPKSDLMEGLQFHFCGHSSINALAAKTPTVATVTSIKKQRRLVRGGVAGRVLY